MRLIDADKLCEQAKDIYIPKKDGLFVVPSKIGTFIALGDVINAPTIDAVPVVRCRECKYWKHEEDVDFICFKQCRYRRADDFCSQGERK